MKKEILNEQDLEGIFSSQKKKKPSRKHRALKMFVIFLLVYVIVFVVVNAGSLYQIAKYWYKTEYKNQNTTSLTAGNAGSLPVLSQKQSIDDNHLYIDKIGINAPVSWKVENDESIMQAALKNGLVHINGTALPGEAGNVFITGHSSDVIWSDGHYKTVFVLLNRLVVGDIVDLKYQGKLYEYKVSEVKVVPPTEISVMDPTDQPRLTLMTCTPVGTALNRLIVISNQTFPAPSGSNSIQLQKNSGQLPAVR